MSAPFDKNSPSVNLGLLLDVDGPIASPVTRTIALQSILDDLVTLTAIGVPIAFITGRSDAFIRESVITPLLANGLSEALTTTGARMFGVYEKGATWSTITSEGQGPLEIDDSLAPPAELIAAIRSLVESDFADVMFFDDTKRAMISVEQRTDVSLADYQARRESFDDQVFAIARHLGVGINHKSSDSPNQAGQTPFRIDQTIISTDVESVLLDKDHGARRALAHFAAAGPLPRTWRSVGDSRSDYKMADELFHQGFDTAHVDVRPGDGVLTKPYEVITLDSLIHDEAGATFLRQCVTELRAHSN